MSPSRWIILAVGLLCVGVISPTPVQVWISTPDGMQPAGWPAPAHPAAALTRADLDGNGQTEQLTRSDATAHLIQAGQSVWRSPAGWRVHQAEFSDLNHDQRLEATLLVWRPFRPLPVDRWMPYGGRIDAFHDSAGQSCQIILIGWRRGAYREVWAGSALAAPLDAFAAVDLDGNGRQELVTREHPYDAPPQQNGVIKIWDWNGFSFLLRQSLPGTYRNMLVITAHHDGQPRLLVQP